MPDLKFACPHCQQHIAAEPGYAGMAISCPACQGSMTVPGQRATAAPTYARAPHPPPTVPSAPAPSSASVGCPSCGGPLPRSAVLCTQCGYNLKTGQRTVAGRPAPPGKPATPQWETPWYKTAYPYVGFVVIVLAALYYLGKENPGMRLAFLGAAFLFIITAHIIVWVAAFKESVGTGFLTLCVPFYALYFVFKVSESATLKILYCAAVLVSISVQFLVKS